MLQCVLKIGRLRLQLRSTHQGSEQWGSCQFQFHARGVGVQALGQGERVSGMKWVCSLQWGRTLNTKSQKVKAVSFWQGKEVERLGKMGSKQSTCVCREAFSRGKTEQLFGTHLPLISNPFLCLLLILGVRCSSPGLPVILIRVYACVLGTSPLHCLNEVSKAVCRRHGPWRWVWNTHGMLQCTVGSL